MATPSSAATSTGSSPGQSKPEAKPEAGEIGDVELVRRLRKGDAEAGNQLVRRHTPALLAFLRKSTGKPHLAEDLHQATWASALQHLPNFDEKRLPADSRDGAFKAWLFRIAANKTRDYFRSSGRARRHGKAFAEEAPLHENPSPSVDQAERDRQLREAIDKLPPAQKEVVVLRYYAQMKFTDVAAVVGCPLNTALGRMHKAAQKLRAMLGEDFLQ